MRGPEVSLTMAHSGEIWILQEFEIFMLRIQHSHLVCVKQCYSTSSILILRLLGTT